MAEETTGQDPIEQRTDYVPATGAHGAHISDADAAAARASQASAEQLGVDQASFDKYYNGETAEFNWQAYAKELEFKASQRGQEPAETQEPTTETQPQEAQGAVEQAGLNWDTLGEKIIESGDIEEADYKALADIGVPKEVVESYVGMVKTQAGDMMADIMTKFGGEEQFNVVLDNLQDVPMDRRNSIDDLLRDPSTRDAGVAAALAAANVQPQPAPTQQAAPQGANNRTAPAQDTEGFRDFDEQVRAQRDPRYYSDPEYREQVMQRIARSKYEFNPRSHTSGL